MELLFTIVLVLPDGEQTLETGVARLCQWTISGGLFPYLPATYLVHLVISYPAPLAAH